MAIIEQLGCSKVCAVWVPQILTVVYKEQRSSALIWHWRWELPAAYLHGGWNLAWQFRTQTQVVFDGMVASPKKKKFKS